MLEKELLVLGHMKHKPKELKEKMNDIQLERRND